MKFRVEETSKNGNYYLLNLSKNCLKGLKQVKGNIKLELDFDALNLGTKLYGDAKIETKNIQKNNCKQLLYFFKICKKAIKFLGYKNFDGILYVRNLKQKKNNNDFIICAMLDVSKAKPHQKLRLSYEYACIFLDLENSLNNMCDFVDNRCAKHRAKGIEKTTGCCASFCKLRVPGTICPHKNLSCKIFMCDYLINEKGFYFTPHTIPVLKQHMSIFERAICFGLLCRTERKSLSYLHMVRGFSIFFAIIVLMLVIIAFL